MITRTIWVSDIAYTLSKLKSVRAETFEANVRHNLAHQSRVSAQYVLVTHEKRNMCTVYREVPRLMEDYE